MHQHHKTDAPPHPWTPGKATERIWALAKTNYTLVATTHARQQLAERKLIMGDALHVLKVGHIYEDGQPSTRPGFYKYKMESSTPNSHSRTLRVVVVPSACEKVLKIVTVMWRDEEASFGNAN